MAVQHRSSNAADTVTAFACNQPASCANVPGRPSSDRVQPGGQAFKSPWLHRENVTYQDHRSAAADPREGATEQGNLMACLLPGGRMARDHPPYQHSQAMAAAMAPGVWLNPTAARCVHEVDGLSSCRAARQ